MTKTEQKKNRKDLIKKFKLERQKQSRRNNSSELSFKKPIGQPVAISSATLSATLSDLHDKYYKTNNQVTNNQVYTAKAYTTAVNTSNWEYAPSVAYATLSTKTKTKNKNE